MQIQDVYKFVYQGVMGSSHAVISEKHAAEWLRDELLKTGVCGDTEETVEMLSDSITRVNLRPFVASGGDTDALLEAFLRTARNHRGSFDNLTRIWNTVAVGLKRFSLSEIVSFTAMQSAAGFPAVHHSCQYRKLYRPAYRVVCAEELSLLLC